MGYQLGHRLAALEPYAPISGTYAIRLDANESFATPPAYLQEKILRAVGKLSLNRYPDALASEVSTTYANFYGMSPDFVTAGNGSDELISLLTSCFLEPDDTVVTLSQDFSMYAFYGSLYGLNVAVCPKEDDGTIDVDALIAFCKAQNAKALLFSNPCNPTSLGLVRDEVRKLLDALSCLVILDEAYMDFWDQSMLGELQNYDNCVILKTCSKAIGLAGIRLGFAVANPTITKALRAAKSPYNTDAIAQAIGTAVLTEPSYLNGQFVLLRQQTAALYDLNAPLLTQYPTILTAMAKPCTNFVYLRTPRAAEIHKALLARSIAVRMFAGALRITAGSAAENAAVSAALREILADFSR